MPRADPQIARGITPRLADALRSLAESQLQTQISQSAALDARALGVMGVNAAIAAIILSAHSAYHLWIAALALLGASLALAVRALLLTGAERLGPLVGRVLVDRQAHGDRRLEQWLLEDLAADMLINRNALARKAPWITGAFALMALAILVELAGRIH